jgi:type I restriction enzyme, R subunit
MKPEERDRQTIDWALTQAGWAVQGFSTFNLTAAQGMAIREFPLTIEPAD